MTRARPSIALLTLVAACAAPAAERATGPLADEIERAIATGTASFDHDAWDGLLAGGTRDGLVDYGYMAAHAAELDAYLDSLAAADLAALSGPELEALLINAYNALTVRAILDHPEVSSIREIDGVWKERTHRVGGFDLTLDEIEHGLLRPYFHDPRVHVAVNCASWSCPPLPPWAFDGDRLDAQLEEWTGRFFADPEHAVVRDGKLWLSRILDWYGGDFTAPDAAPRADTLARFVARYASDGVAAFVEEKGGDPPIEFFEYDWSLNDAARLRPGG